MLGRCTLALLAAVIGCSGCSDSSTPQIRRDGPSVVWVTTGATARDLATRDRTLAQRVLDGPSTFVEGSIGGSQDQVPDGYRAVPFLRYASYAAFHADAVSGRMSSVIRAVEYDPEAWPQTPASEQAHPFLYMRRFARVARAHHLLVMLSPARDLGLVRHGACTKRTPAETLDRSYLRCGLAAAARGADVFVIQGAADEFDTPSLETFVRGAAAQARAANPSVTIVCTIGTSPSGRQATQRQLLEAARVIRPFVDGYSIRETSNSFSLVAAFLSSVVGIGES
jgi:hypothetical protein